MLAVTFDIGTTAVKAVVVNENGEPVFTGSSVIHTIETGNFCKLLSRGCVDIFHITYADSPSASA